MEIVVKSENLNNKQINVKIGTVENRDFPQTVYINISFWVKPKNSATESCKGRKILEEKLKYQQKIDKDFLPWSKLLADVARAIPQNLVIDQISKQERPDIIGNVNYLEIKGRINQGKSPLQSLSFFILNLNENAKLNSILNNAKASNVKFDDKDSCYTFDLTADIKLPEVKEPQEKKAKG